MKKVSFLYGKGVLEHTFGDELLGVLTSSIEEYVPRLGGEALVSEAMAARAVIISIISWRTSGIST